MKFFITLLFSSILAIASGQNVYKGLDEFVAALNIALLQKDTVLLMDLLHPDVTFGHSNGWVETKKEVIQDLATGYLDYEKLVPGLSSMKINGDWASVRMNLEVKGMVNQKSFEMKLYVLQVWKLVSGKWQLIARQSAKIDK